MKGGNRKGWLRFNYCHLLDSMRTNRRRVAWSESGHGCYFVVNTAVNRSIVFCCSGQTGRRTHRWHYKSTFSSEWALKRHKATKHVCQVSLAMSRRSKHSIKNGNMAAAVSGVTGICVYMCELPETSSKKLTSNSQNRGETFKGMLCRW